MTSRLLASCEAEVLLSQGQPLGKVCRELEISELTYYRSRKEYSGQSKTTLIFTAVFRFQVL